MRSLSFQRALLALLPSLVIGSVIVSAIWGDNGLVARHALRADVRSANADLARIELENQRLMRDLAVGERDPVVLERMVAEELGWAQRDATIYRFTDQTGVDD